MTSWDRYHARQLKDPEMKELVEKELQELSLGIQIARLREAEGLNQTEFAALAGMNASKVSVIENSPRNATLATLIRLASAANRKIKLEFIPRKGKKRLPVARVYRRR